MDSLNELKQKLQSKRRTERRDAARTLGEMYDQREQAVPLLKERLEVDDDDDVIKACVDALEQLNALDDEAFEILQKRADVDESGSVRSAAIRGLAKWKARVQDVVPLLKERLKVDDDDDVIKACVDALEQLGALDDEVFEILQRRKAEDRSRVRRGVVRGLVRFQSHVRETVQWVKERLEVDDDDDVIKACVEALEQLNALDDEAFRILQKRLSREANTEIARVIIQALHDKWNATVEQLSRILSQNPHFPWSAEEFHHLWHRGGVVSQVVERTKRLHWWRLSPQVRRTFGPPWFMEHWWHHCPECRWMWHELRYLLKRAGRGRGELEMVLATLSRWWGDRRWRFRYHDFEELMSLRVEQNVTYEEVNTLRFRFLDAFATDKQQRPIAEWARTWLSEFRQNWEELLQTEEQFDRVRDEIADLRRQQDEILKEAERRMEGEWRWERGEPPRLPQDLQGRWNEIAGQLRRLEGDEEPGELQRLRAPLEQATERLLPQLRERDVRFRVIEVEGVLGEYSFYERKVTLFPPMIELAARDLATTLQRQPGGVYEDLYTIVEMHETAHATVHLGIDSNGALWEKPELGSHELHEMLAQFYTIRLIQRLKESRLEQVFLELNKRQPERYQFWQVLQGVPLEMVRVFLIGKRTGAFPDDLLTLTQHVGRIIGSAMPLLATVLSSQEFQAFTGGLKLIVQRLESAQTRRHLGEAAEAFFAHCEQYPFVRSLLENALPQGFPLPDYRKLLLANTLAEGEAVKGPALRLTMEQIEAARTAVLMQNELVLRNEIVHGLRKIS